MESATFSAPEIVNRFRFQPYKHQAECLIKFGRKPYFALLAEMGTGKAQPLTAKVLTDTGWIEIGSLKVGNEIFSADGTLTRVNAIYPQGKKVVYRVNFNDGTSTECCKEHLWLTGNSAERQAFRKGKIDSAYSVKNLETIMQKTHDGAGNAVHYIPISKQIKFSNKKIAIDPYTLGVLLGDGCLRYGTKFTNSEDFIVKKVKNSLPIGLSLYSNENNHNIKGGRNNPYKESLDAYGLMGKYSYEKFIPKNYKFNDEFVMTSILQGLMDTDGTVEEGVGVLSTTSEKLANDVADIVRSLGGIARVKKRINCGYFNNGIKTPCRDGFVVRLNLPVGICPFSLPRKKELYKPTTKYTPKNKAIKSIEKIEKKECICISVDHPSKLYVTDGHIVTHNTAIIINNVADLWSSNDCDALLVIAPNGVHTNWTSIELPKHMPEWVRWRAAAWRADPKKHEKEEIERLYEQADGELRIFTMNWEALQTKRGLQAAERFCNCSRRLMIVADESDSAKNPAAERTKSLMKLKKYSSWRRIMTGTPINNSPFDAFAQFSFLSEDILGTTSFFAFKAEYAELMSQDHGLMKHIVENKTRMSAGDRGLLTVAVQETYKLIAENRRDELTDLALQAMEANDAGNTDRVIEKFAELKGAFSAKPNPKKTMCLQWMAKAEEIIMKQQRHVASYKNPKRLPQIVEKDKTGRPKYRNLEKLSRLIAPHSFRVLKSECLDLPEKIYKTLIFNMTQQQIEVYKKAEEECRLLFEGEETPFVKLVAVTKLAQITSGYYIHPMADEPVRIAGENPKLDLLVERVMKIVESGAKVIVWARYRIEIADIVARLQREGLTTEHDIVEYHGGVGKDDRKAAIESFERGGASVFVANQQAGGTGITLIAAEYVIYFSNNFSLRDRLQSEDRAHRIGQTKNVVYLNIAAKGTIDEMVISCLTNKKDIADTIIDEGLKLFS